MDLQQQMQLKEQLRQEAYQEYLKEKDQVENVIRKMIEEDQKLVDLTRMKQGQAKLDMVQSLNEKRELLRKQQELEEYENELMRRFAEQQEMREEEIREKKAELEAARESIF